MPESQTEFPAVVAAAEDKLSIIMALLAKAELLGQEADTLEAQARAAREQQENITSRLLPDIFRDLGLTELRLRDGSVVRFGQNYFASVSRANRDAAFAWLRERNMGAIIKQEIQLDARHTQVLLDAQIPFELKEAINPQTLKAFVRERIEANDETFPRELFGVHVEDAVSRKGA